ncbi:MAG: hypothetical protein COT81_02915 [Candidatus Buchananbacteria bacterium CG10_big_fil_rev_8_21_14_0_10_42_9]|uniref:Inositol monophosphatase n=1 Tax=Candidatus Buchananbacteria bacterium CG10_big_fil_rev_8_21_14_0_10_42_9 TaxID=1974526 RepID=A0A2H0W158_9BACT|nr:MAG: hypothetical protein COT81_02915 [Candidatus Buchananbacteria bacterium CG10_big_fil_rev_8_21_14_0_10_42_9]
MKNYKTFSIDLARRAGKIMRENFALGMKKEWKGDGTPLTVTDTTINQIVIDAVRKEFPQHNILAEEGSDMGRDSEYTWVCDPVDGTIPFSHGVPTSTFSLALTKNGEAILGVAYDPFMNRMYFAEKGKGAFLNNEKIKVSQADNFASKIIGLGVWRNSTFTSLPLMGELEDRRAMVVSYLSMVYTGCMVASGEFVATIYVYKFPWDAAALKILVEEAGGKVTSLFGEEQRYDQDINGVLVTNGKVHNELLQLIKKSVTKREN